MFLRIRHPQPNPIWFAGLLEVKFHVEVVNEGISCPDIATEQLIYFNEPLFVVNEVIQETFYCGLLCWWNRPPYTPPPTVLAWVSVVGCMFISASGVVAIST